jgi:ribosomal-protein-serine acetyltransferase
MFSHPLPGGAELRLLERHHADALFRAVDADRERLRRWLPWVDATRSPADSLAYIATVLERFAAGNGFDAAIWEGGCVVGGVGMHAIDRRHEHSSLGYWIAASHEGRGLIGAACTALLDHAFGALALHRMEIRCEPENRRSRAIPERLGFREEGTLREVQRIGDRRTDLVVYGMLAPEWNARRGG